MAIPTLPTTGESSRHATTDHRVSPRRLWRLGCRSGLRSWTACAPSASIHEPSLGAHRRRAQSIFGDLFELQEVRRAGCLSSSNFRMNSDHRFLRHGPSRTCCLAGGGLNDVVKRSESPASIFLYRNPDNAKKNRVLRQSRSGLLTVSGTLFNNRCHVSEAETYVGPTIPDCRFAWVGLTQSRHPGGHSLHCENSSLTCLSPHN